MWCCPSTRPGYGLGRTSIVTAPGGTPFRLIRAGSQLAASPSAVPSQPDGRRSCRHSACLFPTYCIGGFRAPALPLRTCSYRHVLCSFGTALPELGGLALYPETRIALYPTGRLYLYRFAPRATFRPSAPRTRASTLSTSGVPPYRQLRCQVWLHRCRWDELYASGAALSIPCNHMPLIRRHPRARGNHSQQSHVWATADGRDP